MNRIYLGDNRATLKAWPDNFVDACITDPPYELTSGKKGGSGPASLNTDSPAGRARVTTGFMGHAWDGSGVAHDVTFWAEVLRVMKPGAHLLAFAGTRTYHRMTCAIEDAGFEIRDQAQWLYGQGFPKSLNVSMQLDKMDSVETRRERALRFTGWMKASGITSKQVNDLTASNMGGHYLTDKEQPEVATADMFDKLRPHLPEVPADIEELVRWRTVESENFKRRKITGTKIALDPAKVRLGVPGRDAEGRPLRGNKEINLTEAHTELAKKWEGWGTALKPANEPIVLARKPLDGTVADNVMRWGTGALNIDACRVDFTSAEDEAESKGKNQHAEFGTEPGGNKVYGDFSMVERKNYDPVGRWPANLIVMHHPACVEVAAPVWACVPNCPMRMMEAQTPGASKFFYVAKPDGGERNSGLEDSPNFHPTVKPIDLMAYLIKLVTPGGGVVLDPFMGSGTTGIAAARLGHPYLGCELSPEYLTLAEKRIAAETAQGGLF